MGLEKSVSVGKDHNKLVRCSALFANLIAFRVKSVSCFIGMKCDEREMFFWGRDYKEAKRQRDVSRLLPVNVSGTSIMV